MNKKILILIVIAGLLGFGSWYLSRQQTQQIPISQEVEGETTNWKIYRNEKYGFQLKYPNDWLFDIKTEKVPTPSGEFLDIHISNFGAGDGLGCDKNYAGLEIQTHTKDANQDFASFVQSQLSGGLGSPSGETEQILIGGHVGFMARYSGWGSGCSGPGYLIEQDESRYLYIFTGSYSMNEREIEDDAIKKIIYSIEFLK